MFWGFETNISSPSPQIAGGICLSKTSSLGQIIIANISLDVSIAPTGFSLSITWYRKESQVLTWFLILQDAFFLQTPSAQSVEGNPFLSGSLRNPVYAGCIRGRPRGCVHLLVIRRATSPGVCQARATYSEQRLSHRLWQGEPWPQVGPEGIRVPAGRSIPALAELQVRPVSQEPEGLGLGLVDLWTQMPGEPGTKARPGWSLPLAR